MEKLIKLLNQYFDSHEATGEDCGMMFFDDPYTNGGEDMMDEIWNTCFIGSHWNGDAVRVLYENGYSTRTFEKDSFGILIAGIGKDNKWLSIG